MQFRVPGHRLVFDVPDEWWAATPHTTGVPNAPHYCAGGDSVVVPIEDVEPPLRDGGKIWFRDRDSVVQILNGMRSGEELPPILVWSREKRTQAATLFVMAYTASTSVSRSASRQFLWSSTILI